MAKVLKPSNIDSNIKVKEYTHKLLSKSLSLTQVLSNTLLSPKSLDSNTIRVFLRSLANMRVLFKNVVKLKENNPLASQERIRTQTPKAQEISVSQNKPPKTPTKCSTEWIEKHSIDSLKQTPTEVHYQENPLGKIQKTPFKQGHHTSLNQGQETIGKGDISGPSIVCYKVEGPGSKLGELKPKVEIGAGDPKRCRQIPKNVLRATEGKSNEICKKQQSLFKYNFQNQKPMKSEDFLKIVLGDAQGMEKLVKIGHPDAKKIEEMSSLKSEPKVSRRGKKKKGKNHDAGE